MAQWVRVFARKPEDLSSNPGAQVKVEVDDAMNEHEQLCSCSRQAFRLKKKKKDKRHWINSYS